MLSSAAGDSLRLRDDLPAAAGAGGSDGGGLTVVSLILGGGASARLRPRRRVSALGAFSQNPEPLGTESPHPIARAAGGELAALDDRGRPQAIRFAEHRSRTMRIR